MPSWTARLNIGSPQSSRPSPKPKTHDLRNPTQVESPTEWTSQDSPLHSVPALIPPTRPAVSPWGSEQNAQHSRSRSTPFPTIVGSHDAAGKAGSAHDLFHGHNALPEGSRTHGFAQDAEKDFAKGSCATCDTKVRWPRNLDTFRCTICLMVNDLKPTSAGSGCNGNKTSSFGEGSCSRGECKLPMVVLMLTYFQSLSCLQSGH